MSSYLTKSNENIECAKFLYKSKRYYPSIIHSSYYSAFQLVKHILLNELLRDENSLNDEQKNKNIGRHELYNNLIVKNLNESDADLALEINNDLTKLKKYRIDSDYRTTEFRALEYGLIIKLAENILNKLQIKFNIK